MSKERTPKTFAATDAQDAKKVFESVNDLLRPRSGENDRAYAGLLLWAMMTPDARPKGKRMLGRAMDVRESTIRYWSKRHSWSRRIALCENAEFEALRAYRILMDIQTVKSQSDGLMVALDVVLERAGLADVRHLVLAQRAGAPLGAASASTGAVLAAGAPSGGQTSGAPTNGAQRLHEHPNRHEQDALQSKVVGGALSDSEIEQLDATQHLVKLREDILQGHLRIVDVKRQIGLIDACLAYIAQKLRAGELKVEVRDIPSLLRARALLTGLPTEQIAMSVNHNQTQSVNVVVESTRMRNARGKGQEAFLGAIKAEYEEIGVIVNAIPTGEMND